jgi:hypothetical protein
MHNNGPNGKGRRTYCPLPLAWYFTFLHAGRHFRNYPVKKKKECEQGRIELTCLGVLIVSYRSPPLTYPAWRNVHVKYQHGRGTECSGTNRILFHSQNCNFPEESFILISFCYIVGRREAGSL